MASKNEMSVLDHIEELRWHLIRSIIAVLCCAVVAFLFPHIILDVILFGPSSPDFWTYRQMCQLSAWLHLPALCISEFPVENFQNIKMGAEFTWHVWVSILSGLIVAFPYIVWEIWRFIKPGLHDKEKHNITAIVFYTTFLFLSGIAFGYFILAPLTVNFFLTYNASSFIETQPIFTSYLSTVTTVVVGTGLTFELPVFVYFLAKMGLITPRVLKKYRRHALIVILVISAILTPPDIASQIIISIPLLLLYEIGIFVAARVERNENKALEKQKK